jgi:sugar O-acyltransferase (sialic acid O-acetyltransferase NeuD family)
MRRDIVVYGTGGTSRDIVDALEAADAARPSWNVLGFLDDNPSLLGKEVYGYGVLGGADAMARPELRNAAVVIGVANDRQLLIRKKLREKLSLPDDRFPVVTHPLSYISPKSSIGPGTVILSGSFCSGNARLGAHVIVLQNSVIGHDDEIGDFVSVSATVSMGGSVKIGEGAYIGLGSTLMPGIRIGAQSRVGLGAVVIRDVADQVTVAGNPARMMTIQPQGAPQ